MTAISERRLWALTAAGAGLLAGLALPPLGCPPLLWPAVAVLWACLAGGSRRPAMLWGAAAVLVSHRWLLWLHPLDWIGVPGPLSLPLALLLWTLCALLGALLVGLWAGLVAWLDPRRLSTALIGASVWGLAEVLLARGPLFWIGLGAAALPGDRPLAGLAALGGAGLLAALQLLIGWGLWRALSAPAARLRWLCLLLAGVLAVHLLGAGVLAVSDREGAPAGGAERGGGEELLVLQPAIPTRQKFAWPQQLRLLRQLEAALSAPAGATTLLLPEGALALDQQLPLPASLEVLSGGFRRVGREQRSSLLRFAPGALDPGRWLDKHRLVPLGEWVPLAGLASWSGLSAVGGLTPGEPSRLLLRPDASAVGVAICYEIADGTALAAASRGGARWLLASANLDPYPPLLQGQYAALARLRAIETGRWLVSSANTGPSLLIDAVGRLRGALPAGESTLGRLRVEPRTTLTAYDRVGEAPLLLLLAAGLLLRLRQPGYNRLSLPSP
ncbi:MAG: apolipoprotein N-acyltransferase [Synechococcaceae cyanobacterium]|nr:apolipoprotein N-acyltransferase [Synechococcaceae cyanobacterium]